MKRKILSTLLVLCMLVSLLPTFALAATTYNDTQDHWAEGAIDRWSGYGVVNGKGEATFDPDGPMRRGEAAQMFANLLGLNKEGDISAYADAQGDWFTSAIAKCVAAGILNGRGDGVMDPNGLITREEFLTMYARAVCISNGTDPAEAKTGLEQKGFADTAQVSDWAADAIGTLVDKGYVNGMTATEIAPQANINRASVMALLDQSVSTYVGKDSTETTVAAKSEGITLIANPAVTTVTGTADVVVVAAGAEQYDAATGEIAHNDIRVESAKMPVARVQGENITVTLALSTTAEDATVTETGVDSIIVIESTSEVKNAAVEAEGAKIIVKDGAKAESVTVAETAKSASVETAKNATVGTVTIAAESATATVAGKVETVKVEETAKNATVETKSTAKVETVENKAENTAVTGSGTVGAVKSSEDVKVETKNTKVENTSETKDIAVTDSKGKETKVETKTENTETTKPETTVNKQETTGGGGGGSSTPAHTHSYTYITNNNGTHNGSCKCGKDPITNEACTFDENGKCTKCEYAPTFVVYDAEKVVTGCYDELQEAMLAVRENGTLKFFKDYELTSQTTDGLGAAVCSIDLNGKTLTASGTWKLSNTAYTYMTYEEYLDLGWDTPTEEEYDADPYPLGMTENPVDVTVKNGDYVLNGTDSGRIRFEKGSTGHFENVDFRTSNNKWYKALQTYATNETGENEVNTYTFDKCTFINCYTSFEGGSGSCNKYDISFTNCEFTAANMGNGAACITNNAYVYGKLLVNKTKFDITSSASGACAYCVSLANMPSSTGKKTMDTTFSDVIMNTSGNSKPYNYTYNSISGTPYEYNVPNATITLSDTNVFTYDEKNVEQIVDKSSANYWSVSWVSSKEAYEKGFEEWNLFKSASGTTYSASNKYVVEKDGVYMYASGNTFYSNGYRTAFVTEDGFIINNDSYYPLLNKIASDSDLTTGLEEENNAVHIYLLHTAAEIRFSTDNNNFTHVTYLDTTDGIVQDYVYQISGRQEGKQYYTSVGTVANGKYTIDGTTVTLTADGLKGKDRSKINIVDREVFPVTAVLNETNPAVSTSGSGGNGYYYVGSTSKLTCSVTTTNYGSFYNVDSVTVNGKTLDSADYTVQRTADSKNIKVIFAAPADVIIGNVVINISEVSNLSTAVDAFKTEPTYSNQKSYMIEADGTVWVYQVPWTSCAYPMCTGSYYSSATATVTKTENTVSFLCGSYNRNYTVAAEPEFTATNGVKFYLITEVK